jgi:hypothetical protein
LKEERLNEKETALREKEQQLNDKETLLNEIVRNQEFSAKNSELLRSL